MSVCVEQKAPGAHKPSEDLHRFSSVFSCLFESLQAYPFMRLLKADLSEPCPIDAQVFNFSCTVNKPSRQVEALLLSSPVGSGDALPYASACSISECPSNKLPSYLEPAPSAPFLKKAFASRRPSGAAPSAELRLERNCDFWAYYFHCIESSSFRKKTFQIYDLSVNYEGATGYEGPSPRLVWKILYAHATEDARPALDFSHKRFDLSLLPASFAHFPRQARALGLRNLLFYKLLSGLHASVSLHIVASTREFMEGDEEKNLSLLRSKLLAGVEVLPSSSPVPTQASSKNGERAGATRTLLLGREKVHLSAENRVLHCERPYWDPWGSPKDRVEGTDHVTARMQELADSERVDNLLLLGRFLEYAVLKSHREIVRVINSVIAEIEERIGPDNRDNFLLEIRDLVEIRKAMRRHFKKSRVVERQDRKLFGELAGLLRAEDLLFLEDALVGMQKTMACVECPKCKLWGSLQLKGVAVAFNAVFRRARVGPGTGSPDTSGEPGREEGLSSEEVQWLVRTFIKTMKSLHLLEEVFENVRDLNNVDFYEDSEL